MMRLPKIFTIPTILLLVFISGFSFWYSNTFDFSYSRVSILNPKVAGAATIKNQTITLIAVGDIMLSRYVEQKMLKVNDWLYPFRETYQVTTQGDLVFGNLETPLIEGATVNTDDLAFRADPKAVAGLKFGGFNILSLANNHFKNKGEAGIKKSLETLDKNKIAHVGAGLNASQARSPAVITINGIKFGFLAYVDSAFTPASYEATATRAGLSFMNEKNLIEDIHRLKAKVDVIIVSMHAGIEYAFKPNNKQISFAHAAIGNGAALVIGHHPHIVEPMEKYKGGYIIYSLGNFIFDQTVPEETREGAVATVTFQDNKISKVKLTPIEIHDYTQPRVLSATTGIGKEIIDRMTNFTF
jgi:poly-gamma-glutamate capsule biosynthesis protein CapA/YwtB (metallophosphatase superfamily)